MATKEKLNRELAAGQAVGIEILCIKGRIPVEELKRLQSETV